MGDLIVCASVEFDMTDEATAGARLSGEGGVAQLGCRCEELTAREAVVSQSLDCARICSNDGLVLLGLCSWRERNLCLPGCYWIEFVGTACDA